MVAVAEAETEDQAARELAKWTYVMEVAQPLPLIDLEATIISKLLSTERHDRFLEVMRHNYARFGTMYRLAGIISMVIVFIDSKVGCALSIPAMLLAVPAISCSMLMMSRDIIHILTRQYEFWFFTIMNTINWVTLATLYSDLRIVSLLSGYFGTQNVIMIDANFRTVVSALKSCVVAAPVLIIVAIACFFRLLDTPENNYRVIPVANIQVTLVDVFMNTAVTLAVFIARKGYNKRKVIKSGKSSMRIVRCVVFRSKLRLRPITYQDPSTSSAQPQTVIVRQVSTSVIRAVTSVVVPLSSDVCEPGHQQQVTLVSLKLESVDVRRTVAPRFTPLVAPVARGWMTFVLVNGMVGLFLTMTTLTRKKSQERDGALPGEKLAAVLAFVTTSTCCLPFFLSAQRDLLKSLFTNFDYLFSSIQFGLAMIFLADMLRWDYRALGALSWFLWFHLVLLLDTLTPPIKANLRLRKLYMLPVVLLSLVGIALISYSFFFAQVDIFEERTLLAFELNGHDIALRTKSLLLNRLFTVFIWSARLVWEVSCCDENELSFVRGGLDYYNPMEMFPPFSELQVTPLSTAVSEFKRRSFSRRLSAERHLQGSVPPAMQQTETLREYCSDAIAKNFDDDGSASP
ncbi:hypothetical protein Gpo141_00012564 [Globisporangium polare]